MHDKSRQQTPRSAIPMFGLSAMLCMQCNLIGEYFVYLLQIETSPTYEISGMGGNQAMQDSAEALPALLKLASASTNPTEANFVAALQGYENGMIDRAFDWVEQSGGCAIPVSTTISTRLLNKLTSDSMLMLMRSMDVSNSSKHLLASTRLYREGVWSLDLHPSILSIPQPTAKRLHDRIFAP